MLKLIKNISFILALVVVLASCTKDEELLQGPATRGIEKIAGSDTGIVPDGDTGTDPSSLASGGGAPIVDDEDDENDDDGATITDDEDDENDDEGKIKK